MVSPFSAARSDNYKLITKNGMQSERPPNNASLMMFYIDMNIMLNKHVILEHWRVTPKYVQNLSDQFEQRKIVANEHQEEK